MHAWLARHVADGEPVQAAAVRLRCKPSKKFSQARPGQLIISLTGKMASGDLLTRPRSDVACGNVAGD
jgi:hypothetical protein